MLSFLVLCLMYVCGPIPKESLFYLPLLTSLAPYSIQNFCPTVTA